ncbi:hypothetical protein N7532_002381 [Penicillium argentinense]|uniref:INO80 complex, subunit Ies4 n=1 Tax=Penicillium argentinense TaxID=1131581 RepID=A0A9W9G080_9EURO|nr:uncharacterized protein N7532_002381 [Penicillium argentinense]KAJ5109736.1 hypothetical protein N7532_002381 [Penicillium argentinense]
MPAAANGRSNRAGGSKGSLIVKLKISPEKLQQFSTETPDQKPTITTTDKINERSSPASSTEAPAARPSSADNGSEADATSTPATGATPGDTPRRKGVPGPKPGNKRANGQTDAPKQRGRPGPKKKPRLDEGGDLGKIAAAHRLGPKANTGAINAGLRALDRTGAPCRKWEKQPLRLRSFTGVAWQLPSWRTHLIAKSEDSDGKTAAIESGDSDSKPTLAAPGTGTDTVNGSSAVPSEKSNSGDGDVTPAPSNLAEPSSPAIAMAA